MSRKWLSGRRRGGLLFAAMVLGLAIVLGLPAGDARARLAQYNGCEPSGQGNFVCNWSANPVFAPDGSIVGTLDAEPQPGGFASAANTIQCQATGRLVFIALDSAHESTPVWAWARATDGNWGWTSEAGADWGLGGVGAVFQGFTNVPGCGSAHGPAPGNPGYPVTPLRLPAVGAPVAAGAAHGCTAPQHSTVHFRFYEQRYVAAKGAEKVLVHPHPVRFGGLQIADATCLSDGRHVISSNATLHVRSAGLHTTALGPRIAGHGATRGWGIAITHVSRTGAVHVTAVACRRGGLQRSGLDQLTHWPARVGGHYRLGAHIRHNRHARLHGCADLGGIDLSLRADAHGHLVVLARHGFMLGGGLVSQSAYHHRAGRSGPTLYYSRDIVAPSIARG